MTRPNLLSPETVSALYAEVIRDRTPIRTLAERHGVTHATVYYALNRYSADNDLPPARTRKVGCMFEQDHEDPALTRMTTPAGIEVLLDTADVPLVSGINWNVAKDGYVLAGCHGKARGEVRVLMHRLIAGTPDGMDTDHVNRIRTDNRRCNLRVLSRRENLANTTPRSGRRFKGVYSRFNRFAATCCDKYLGAFATGEEAARAYDAAARRLLGPTAFLNFPA